MILENNLPILKFKNYRNFGLDKRSILDYTTNLLCVLLSNSNALDEQT